MVELKNEKGELNEEKHTQRLRENQSEAYNSGTYDAEKKKKKRRERQEDSTPKTLEGKAKGKG